VVDSSHFEPNVVNFQPSWGMPLIAKLVVGGAVLSVIIIALVLLLLVRLAQRIARRRT